MSDIPNFLADFNKKMADLHKKSTNLFKVASLGQTTNFEDNNSNEEELEEELEEEEPIAIIPQERTQEEINFEAPAPTISAANIIDFAAIRKDYWEIDYNIIRLADKYNLNVDSLLDEFGSHKEPMRLEHIIFEYEFSHSKRSLTSDADYIETNVLYCPAFSSVNLLINMDVNGNPFDTYLHLEIYLADHNKQNWFILKGSNFSYITETSDTMPTVISYLVPQFQAYWIKIRVTAIGTRLSSTNQYVINAIKGIFR